jgi:hypothetical protein
MAQLQIKQGPFTHGRVITKEFFETVEHLSFKMVELSDLHAKNILSLNRVVFDPTTPLKGVQICYPDSSGRFPWQQGSDIDYMKILGSAPE